MNDEENFDIWNEVFCWEHALETEKPIGNELEHLRIFLRWINSIHRSKLTSEQKAFILGLISKEE